MFRLVKSLRTDSKEGSKGGRCMRGSDGKLCFSEKERWLEGLNGKDHE